MKSQTLQIVPVRVVTMKLEGQRRVITFSIRKPQPQPMKKAA